jgi:protein dithiol oxidoreductase (disulfide-forming)
MIRFLLAALALVVAAPAFLPSAFAQQPGVTQINPPIETDNKSKVEVVEFFWYECPHCYALEPHLETWLKKLPKHAEFRRVPAMFNQRWALAARVYYTLEAIGELDRLHRPLFEAIHKGGLKITNEKQMLDWLERQKVDVGKFNAALRSFSVESRLKRALALTEASKIDGVPALMVNGRYIVTAGGANTETNMLAITDSLIEESRKQLAANEQKK